MTPAQTLAMEVEPFDSIISLLIADGVRELAFRRNNRFYRPFGQRAMTDFAPARTAESSCFSDAKRWKIVVQDETLGLISARVAVDHLSFLGRSKSRERDCLRFASREKRRPMRPRQQPHFRAQRTQIMESATITTLLSIKNADSERLFLEVIERLRNFERGRIGILRENRCFDFLAEGIHRLAACNFSRGVECRLDAVSGDLVGNFQKIISNVQKRDLTLGLTGNGSEFPLHFNDVADERLSEFERLDKLFFRQLICRALDHHDIFRGADVDQVEVAELALRMSGVNHKFSIDPCDTDRSNRPRKRYIRDAKRS